MEFHLLLPPPLGLVLLLAEEIGRRAEREFHFYSICKKNRSIRKPRERESWKDATGSEINFNIFSGLSLHWPDVDISWLAV